MSWPRVLGVVAPPEDDKWSYSDFQRDPVWQELVKIAEKRGIEISVTDFGRFKDKWLGLCSSSDFKIFINQLVPNWYKPRVLAHELAHFKLHREIDGVAYWVEGEYRTVIELEADLFADRLLRFIKRRLFPDQMNNWREAEKLDRARHERIKRVKEEFKGCIRAKQDNQPKAA